MNPLKPGREPLLRRLQQAVTRLLLGEDDNWANRPRRQRRKFTPPPKDPVHRGVSRWAARSMRRRRFNMAYRSPNWGLITRSNNGTALLPPPWQL